MYDMVIKNGTIVDGTGGEEYKADLALFNGRIVRIGADIQENARRIIDAFGKTICPGFIDMHSHVDCSAPIYPEMESYLGQGITTCFCGHCGWGLAPINNYYVEFFAEEQAVSCIVPQTQGGVRPASGRIVKTDLLRPYYKKIYGKELDWTSFDEYLSHLEKEGVGCNMLFHVPHTQIRLQVMGLDYKREATKTEIEKMVILLEESLKAGANGLSFGLDYPPGIWAGNDELLALAECIKPYNGQLTAHVQLNQWRRGVENKKHTPLDGMKEMMDMALQAGVPLHISHIQNGYTITNDDDGIMADGARRTLEEVYKYRDKGLRVTWDVLPHDTISMFYYPQLANMLRPYVDDCGGKQGFARALQSGDYRNEIAEPIKQGKHRSVGKFSFFNPLEDLEWGKKLPITQCTIQKYVGKTIFDIAQEEKRDSVDVLLDILSEDPETYVGKIQPRHKAATEAFMGDPEASIGLDNGSYNYNHLVDLNDLPIEKGTPTSFCGMICFLERTVPSRFEHRIKCLTGNPAKIIGLPDRGIIKEDYMADLVVINRDILKSNFNLIEPRTAPEGLDFVIINGQVAVENKKHLHIKNGKIYRRSGPTLPRG
jgi:N-acyl-D-aspartate/D-glutamate deacylase